MTGEDRLYMIRSSVKKIDYPGSSHATSIRFKDTRLVWATDSSAAVEKLKKFWDDQYESYALQFEVTVRSISEAIS